MQCSLKKYTHISMMMAEANLYNFNDILSQEKERSRFCEWFWDSTNGNELIDALNTNKSQSKGSKIRRQHKWWPYIYCIVLNDNTNPGRSRSDARDAPQWKYCKVGKTEQDTTTGKHNRMETVMDEIRKKKRRKQSVIFVLPVCASDSRKNNEIEQGVREHIGWKVNKDLAKKNNLPFPTEWVITTQEHIYGLKNQIETEKLKARNCEIDTRVVFSITRFQQDERMLPPHLQKQGNEVVDRSSLHKRHH